ncbi:unnamed protein product [Amoebophrya sp. A25]|nr:unnamed protein product [Amoebophrya sp. A25]|eukprot:GSA25T00012951001.1
MSAAPMVAPPPSTSGVSLTSSGAPGPGGSTLLPATSSVGSTGSSINGNIPPAAAHAGVTSTSGTNGDNATATLSRKVRKVLQLRPDQCREELKKMSSFVTQNTAHTRRNLRTTIEQQSLKVHSTFVEEVGTKIESLLEELEGEIDSLSDLADRVHSDLQNSRKRT